MTDMVIYSGKKGSLVFYFENNIIGSLPLGKRSIDDYYIQRDRLLKEALEAQKLKVNKSILMVIQKAYLLLLRRKA